MKRRVFSLLGLGVIVIWTAALALPDKNLHVIFCDVGQGDATLVVWGRVQVLIDGGPDLAVMECLAKYVPFFDRQIEAVIVTHGHADHARGLISVIERYSVKYFVKAKTAAETAELNELQEMAEKKKTVTNRLAGGDEVVFNRKEAAELKLRVLWPPQTAEKETFEADLNRGSLVVQIDWGGFAVLVTGDADAAVEKQMDLTGKTAAVEVFKVPHHGSRTGLDAAYLSRIDPELAVISVGKNSYGHPAPVTMELLRSVGAEVRRTDTDGTVEVISDGKEWWVR